MLLKLCAFQTQLPLNYYMQLVTRKPSFAPDSQPDWRSCTRLRVPEVKSRGDGSVIKVVVEDTAFATVMACTTVA